MLRYKLRTLLIVLAIAPAVVWAATLWLALLIENAESARYKTSGRGNYASEAAKDSLLPGQ